MGCLKQGVVGLIGLLGVLSAQAEMPHADLSVGFYRVDAEVAATLPDRMQGLMQRTSLGPQQGMVFSFTYVDRHCMWMKNTLIPLSVAFLDEQGVIVNIADMQPQTENNHCAAAPTRYALEMNRGWFSQRGIRAGMRVNGLEKLPPAR